MKTLLSTLLTTALCLGVFSSCVDHEATPPTGGDSLGIPDDDGSVFEPGTTGGDKKATGGGPGETAPTSGAAGGAPDASFVAVGRGGGGSGGKPNSPVPEPTTFLLVGTGLLGAAAARRRRRRAASEGEEDGTEAS